MIVSESATLPIIHRRVQLKKVNIVLDSKNSIAVYFMDDLIIIIALILLNGIFSMSEVALISARKSKLTADAKDGNRNAANALKLQSEPDRFCLPYR